MAVYERKDAAYRRARDQGYRSRAAYKLIELDQHFSLFRRGQAVVDLGCWPGSWMQVAAERVGPTGRVIGLDLNRVDPLGLANAVAIIGDVHDVAVRDEVRQSLGRAADLVLADLAPKLGGIAATDSARHAALVECGVAAASEWLTSDGGLLIKLFMNEEQPALMARLRAAFRTVKLRRPPATRRGSSELYAYARGLR